MSENTDRRTALDRRRSSDPEAATVRELQAVDTRLGLLERTVASTAVDVERRFGRVERLIALLFVAVLAPKVGGPDVAKTVQTAAWQLLT